MRLTLSLKTVYRSPARTLLTFVLLGVATFAFFTRAAEYAITTREMNNAERQYMGVGAVELEPAGYPIPFLPMYLYTDPRLEGKYELGEDSLGVQRYQPLTRGRIDAVAGLPYVTSVDTRYMTAGVSDAFFRLGDSDSRYNVSYYTYPPPSIFEATLTDIWYGKPLEPGGVAGAQYLDRLIVEDIKHLSDYSPRFRPLDMWSIFGDNVERFMLYAGPRTHPAWGYHGYSTFMAWEMENDYTDYLFGPEFLETLEPGSRYLFVTTDGFLGNYFTDSWCEPVRLIDGEPEGYLETEGYAAIRELLEITETDPHTFDVVYTGDMGAITRFATGKIAITDGRALSEEDTESGAQVCVIYDRMSNAFGLEVGDFITLRLGTELFEQFKGLGSISVTRERFKPATEPVTLEIVGICRNLDSDPDQFQSPHWAYSYSTVFVPKSLLPVDEDALSDHLFSPAEVSFLVGNARNFEPFLRETAPLIEAMGLTLIFDDGGWSDVVDAFNEAGSMSVLNVVMFSVAVAAATLLVVYLFIGRKKNEYAIMRALGSTKRSSANALLLPLMTTAAISILAGIGVSWVYTLRVIGGNEALLVLQGYEASTSMPAWVVVSSFLGQLLLTLLFALAMLQRLGKKPPLELLHGGDRARTRAVVRRCRAAYFHEAVIRACGGKHGDKRELCRRPAADGDAYDQKQPARFKFLL